MGLIINDCELSSTKGQGIKENHHSEIMVGFASSFSSPLPSQSFRVAYDADFHGALSRITECHIFLPLTLYFGLSHFSKKKEKEKNLVVTVFQNS